jgi:hypothetical protein
MSEVVSPTDPSLYPNQPNLVPNPNASPNSPNVGGTVPPVGSVRIPGPEMMNVPPVGSNITNEGIPATGRTDGGNRPGVSDGDGNPVLTDINGNPVVSNTSPTDSTPSPYVKVAETQEHQAARQANADRAQLEAKRVNEKGQPVLEREPPERPSTQRPSQTQHGSSRR